MPKRAIYLSDDIDAVDQWNREDAADLERPKGLEKYEIVVASRDWTVETIVRQIEQKNIDLDPAFQRRNAWRDNRRSRLIESFVLGFPVPQLVLAENPRVRGSFIVIDGKQRLLTIASLYLKEYRGYWNHQRFSGLSVLKELNDLKLDAFLEEDNYSKYRRQLGNADIRTTVISGFKDEDVLYDIFYRINTGSVPLSSQELRQVLNRGEFAKFLLETTSVQNPLWRVLGIDNPDPRLRDVELLLRLIALRRFSEEYRGNLKVFLDDSMKKLNNSWRRDQPGVEHLKEEIFEATQAAMKIFGTDVGRRLKAGRFDRALNRALFEVQAYYLSFPGVRTAALKSKAKVAQAAKQLFSNHEFSSSIESTTKSIANYRTRFDAYQRMLEKTLGIKVPGLEIALQK
jgi:hypothetical protein